MSAQNCSDPGISLMKTIVMSLTGEIEYEGIKMEGPGNFKLFSQASFFHYSSDILAHGKKVFFIIYPNFFMSLEDGMQFQEFLLQVVFVLWVFFVMLVLNNLLNGLAVQDIGEIQRDCEVVSAASQVELVAFIESMLLGDPFQVNIAWIYQ